MGSRIWLDSTEKNGGQGNGGSNTVKQGREEERPRCCCAARYSQTGKMRRAGY